MLTVLPWLLIGLGGAAALVWRPAEDDRSHWAGALIGLAAGLVVLGVAFGQGLWSFAFSPAWVGLAGLLVLAGWRPGATVAGLGFVGGIVASDLGALGMQEQTLYLHLTLVGVGALALVSGVGRSGAAVGLAGFGGVAARYFLIPEPGATVGAMPGAVLVAVVVLGIIGSFVPENRETWKPWVGPALGLLLAGIVFGVGAALFGKDHVPRTLMLAVLAAVATAFAMPSGSKPDALRVGLAGLVWLGIATYAFSHSLTLGMSLALVAGAGAIALTASEAAYPMLAPLAGLVGFRLARNVYPEATRAFDLGQHYAVVGVVLAIVLVMVLGAAFGREVKAGGWRIPVATGAGWLLGVLAVLFSVMFLGAKGTTGLIVGIGLAPLIVQLGKADGAAGSGLSVGLIGLLGLAYPKLAELFEVSRAEKQTAFAVAAGVGLVLALFLVWLGRTNDGGAVEETFNAA